MSAKKIIIPLALISFATFSVASFIMWRIQRRRNFYKERHITESDNGETTETNYTNMKNFTEADFRAAAPELIKKHGKELAAKVEQLFRWETAHFKSQQYQKTGAPGMESHGIAPTYGWYAPFFLANPSYLPIGTHTMTENGTGKQKTFVIMPSVLAAAMFVADYIKRYGNPGRWYSMNAASQASYNTKISQVIPRIVNSIA
jgi:hypothetical protein